MHAFGTLPKCVHVYLLKLHSFFIPLQAPCSLDVTTEKSVLTYNIKGTCQPYDIEKEKQQLIK